MLLKLSRVARHLQVPLNGIDCDVQSLAFNSKEVNPQALFVAIKGNKVDGHNFLQEASQFCVAFLLSDASYVDKVPAGMPYLLVEDPLAALSSIAKLWRSINDTLVVGVTGSCGKTTTRNILATILRVNNKTVLETKKNYNSKISLPAVVSNLDNQQYAVLEMGASEPGDIANLADIAYPFVGIITNIKHAHIEKFVDIEVIARTKAELYRALPSNGYAILNMDDAHCPYLLTQIKSNCISFGFNPQASFRAENYVSTKDGSKFNLVTELGSVEINLALLGKHNVSNALAAAAAACALGLSLTEIQHGLQEVRSFSARLQSIKLGNITLINDTYNAIFEAVLASLEILSKASGNKIFVFGQMAELGDRADSFHQEVGKFAKQHNITRLFCFGADAKACVAAFGEGAYLFASRAELTAKLLEELSASKGDETTVLIKGSRATGMEEVVNGLQVGLSKGVELNSEEEQDNKDKQDNKIRSMEAI